MRQNIYSFSDERVFIDIAYGCGNNCDYCYCPEAGIPQAVYTHDILMNSLYSIKNDNRFINGKSGTVISLCPHTEPFKSAESAEALLTIVRDLLPLGNRIQISTKERIPKSFLSLAETADDGQITVFISISSLTGYRTHEPFAASIEDRLSNIDSIRGTAVKSCIYIKPLLLEENDIPAVFRIIAERNPGAVCIGIEYKHDQKGVYKHPTDHALSSEGMSNMMKLFCESYHLDVPLFYTSSCVISYFNHMYNGVAIPQNLCAICDIDCARAGKWQN